MQAQLPDYFEPETGAVLTTPDVHAQAPPDANTLSCAMNIRVRDVHATYEEWRSRGGEFLTPPRDHELEIRCYLRATDGYLIEVGQGTCILEQMGRRTPQ